MGWLVVYFGKLFGAGGGGISDFSFFLEVECMDGLVGGSKILGEVTPFFLHPFLCTCGTWHDCDFRCKI